MATDGVLSYLKECVSGLSAEAAESAVSKGISHAVVKTNRAIYELGRSRSDYEGMELRLPRPSLQ